MNMLLFNEELIVFYSNVKIQFMQSVSIAITGVNQRPQIQDVVFRFLLCLEVEIMTKSQ